MSHIETDWIQKYKNTFSNFLCQDGLHGDSANIGYVICCNADALKLSAEKINNDPLSIKFHISQLKIFEVFILVSLLLKIELLLEIVME